MDKRLYLIRGLPGSGKTTIARKLNQWGCHFEADQFHMVDGVYKWKPENVAAAHQWCRDQVEHLMMQDYADISVGNTFTRHWEMEPYRDLARKYGYTVTTLTVDSGLSDEELAVRNIHSVPAESIRKMRERWEA